MRPWCSGPAACAQASTSRGGSALARASRLAVGVVVCHVVFALLARDGRCSGEWKMRRAATGVAADTRHAVAAAGERLVRHQRHGPERALERGWARCAPRTAVPRARDCGKRGANHDWLPSRVSQLTAPPRLGSVSRRVALAHLPRLQPSARALRSGESQPALQARAPKPAGDDAAAVLLRRGWGGEAQLSDGAAQASPAATSAVARQPMPQQARPTVACARCDKRRMAST